MFKKRLLLTLMLFTLTFCMQARIVFSSIDTAGFYQLADDVTNQININVSDVTFDLNGHSVSGGTNGIVIAAGLDCITIKNGSVDGIDDGISVGAGATNITLRNIIAKDSVRGINFTQVTGGIIKNCEMTLNTTGLALDNCHKIIVKECVASCNTHAGYDLISSTTNFFENCKALSTGEGNTNVIDNNVFGFVSTSGYGNIFERCIANSTQALTTTDLDSRIAGFALRSTEGCSKIVECEAANSMTSPSGFTTPYGILLQETLETVQTVTGGLGTSGTVSAVSWSSDGRYVAAGGSSLEGTGEELQIFEFERISNQFILIGSFDVSASVLSIDWSPDAYFLAVGVSSSTAGGVFEFDIVSHELIFLGAFNSVNPGTINSCKWSPDGRFIAVGGLIPGDDFQIYEFDRSSLPVLISVANDFSDSIINAVDWSPDGKYIAVGATTFQGGLDELQVLEFNKGTSTLTRKDSALGTVGQVNTVAWSTNGKYLAVGGEGLAGGLGEEFQLFSFNRDTETLSTINSIFGAAGEVNSIAWSPDGKFIIVGGDGLTGGSGQEFQVLRFDPSVNELTAIDGSESTGEVNSVDWSPDGGAIAFGGSALSNDQVKIVPAYSFPEKNIVKSNQVYCNSGNTCPGGVGVSGSNIASMIINNIAYSNPIPRAADEPIVSSNYQFVTNIFDTNSASISSPIANIATTGCQPPAITMDLAESIRVLTDKICDIQSKVDTLV